jgi:hypothetical protein
MYICIYVYTYMRKCIYIYKYTYIHIGEATFVIANGGIEDVA